MHGSRHVLLAFLAAFLATAIVVAGLRADPGGPSTPTFPGSKQLGEWNSAHVTSVTHTAGVVRGFGVRATDVVDITNAALNVNCVVGCSGSSAANPIPHVSSVTHIVGSFYLTNRAGTAVTVTTTSLDVNCTAGCSGGVNTPVNQSGMWTIQGAHQLGEWNLRHVTSVTHVYGTVSLVSRAGGYATFTGTSLDVNCTAGCAGGGTTSHITSVTHIYGTVSLVSRAGTYASVTGTSLDVNLTNTPAVTQSGEWNVRHIGSRLHVVLIPSSNANDVIAVHATQTGNWNIGHVTSVSHIYGFVSLVNQAKAYATFTGTSLDVNCTGGCSSGGTVSHITSVSHIYGTVSLVARDGTYAAFTTTSLNVNVTNAPSVAQSGEWNVRHISSVQHVSIVDWRPWLHITSIQHITGSLHVAGTIKGAQFHVTGLGTPGQTHGGVFTIQGVTGMIPIKVDQNTLAWNTAHVGSVTHVAGYVFLRDAHCATCVARIDHYNVLVVQPHISGAMRAWRVASCGTGASLAVASNPNRRDLIVTIAGNRPVYIGYGTAGHVALTQANGFPLHAMGFTSANGVMGENHSQATLTLPNYNGPLACIAPAASDMAILEILR